MNLQDLEKELPHGFADAILERIDIDYVANTVALTLSLWVGGPGTPERYRRSRITIRHLRALSIDPPRYEPEGDTGPVWVDGAPGEPGGPASPGRTDRYWFFVHDRSSYIRIDGQDVALEWLD